MFNPHLSIKFENGELIQGVEWKDLSNQSIYSMKLKLNDKTIYLSGYKEYNHLIEFVYTFLEGKKMIRHIYLMGRTEEHSQIIRINCLTGKIEEYKTKYDEEYAATPDEELWVGRPCTGWKKGLINSIPEYTIK